LEVALIRNEINQDEYLRALRSPIAENSGSIAPWEPLLVTMTDRQPPSDLDALHDRRHSLPGVVIGLGNTGASIGPLVDVILEPDDPMVATVIANVTATPQASSALAVVLRGAERRTVGEGLAVESAAYSMLQAGPEFGAWRAGHPARDRPSETEPTVRVTRDDDRLDVALSRPHVHNAFSAKMRDELLDALSIAWTDDTIREVVLSGDGPSFCSGGDLDEFGTFPDPATAHLVRLTRSAGRALATISDRVVARIHGACMGSGIELPAFAARVIAAPDTKIGLPEVGMGLIPGAGGTVSLPRRIGRHRTAWLALTRTTIDAATALDWGLVDAIEP
jgi:enoyl-CoA hydratase/isomerase-like protein